MSYDFIVETGVILPDSAETLLEVQMEYKEVLGADLVVTPDTPQGVLITAEALARIAVLQNNVQIANQINPNVAEGVFLDALLSLTGVERTRATRTLVPGVTMTGIAGTTISAGTRAKTATDDLFETLNPAVLDGSGEAFVDFVSVEYGPISCDVNTLNLVVTNVLGWETVNNTLPGILGTNTQSDQSARAFRRNTLAFGGVSLAEAITSALYHVEGVRSLHFQENVAATTEVINGISMVAHSVYACVDGGTDLDVAAALLENKSSGAAWNGAEVVNVIEPSSGQEYEVKFARPTAIPILVKVTTSNGDTANIKSAILAYAAGLVTNMEGFIIGADISPFEISGAINVMFPETFVNKVEITKASLVAYSTDVIEIEVDEIATIDASSITVVSP